MINFDELGVPFGYHTGTSRVCVTLCEKIKNKETNELIAIRLHCKCGKMKNNLFRWNFKVRINTLYSKITEEDIKKANGRLWIDLENPVIIPYAFLNEKKVLIKGTYVIADDFTIVPEEDLEVDIYA
ncbi:hypothetical protein ACSXCI_01970 [Clostridium perfringens]